MVRLPFLLCCLCASPLFAAEAVDFLGAGDAAEEDEATGSSRESDRLPPEQQAQLYRELFAEEEAAADSSREELQLAITLVGRAEDISDLRDEVATDPDAALEVGAYDLAHGAYQAALDSLAMAEGEAGRHLADSATVAIRMAEGADLGLDDLQTLADALDAQRRSDAPIRRRLVNLAIELRDHLAVGADQITTLRIQAVGEDWDALAEALGPDPLEAVSLAGGVSESQLLRMGWVAIFDHRTFPGSRGPVETDDLTMQVRPDGILELRAGPDQLSGPGSIDDMTGHRQTMVRFRITEMEGDVHFGFSAKSRDASDVYRLHAKGMDELKATTSFQDEFGSLPLAPEGEWNDLVWTFSGRKIQAELNGEPFEPHTMDNPATRLKPWIKTRGGERITLEIQSILYRD